MFGTLRAGFEICIIHNWMETFIAYMQKMGDSDEG
jgi:hypothetical protein